MNDSTRKVFGVALIALAAATVVVDSWWLHLLLVLGIVLALVPVGVEFARRES